MCLALGLFSGFLGGLLGIGGGVVIVPVLYFLFTLTGQYPPELAMLVAIATSLSCIVFTSASAALTQIKAQRVNWDIVYKLLPFLLIGSFSAGYIAPNLPPGILRWMFWPIHWAGRHHYADKLETTAKSTSTGVRG